MTVYGPERVNDRRVALSKHAAEQRNGGDFPHGGIEAVVVRGARGGVERAVSGAVGTLGHAPDPLIRSSGASGRIAAVELTERARGEHAEQKDPDTCGDNLIRSVYVEFPHSGDEQIGNNEVRKSPEHVHSRR